ncbi:MAG: hypothetical protein IKN45_08170, partial [Lachnospiraceae bacterium]|nr:hypothetical protein [Lachnospiraceae bacterium]
FDDYLSEHVFEGCSEASVKLPNGKTVHVGYERTNGGMVYFGIHLCYNIYSEKMKTSVNECVKDRGKGCYALFRKENRSLGKQK